MPAQSIQTAAKAGVWEREVIWREKKEELDVLEPEKCPLPRDVGPFFPLLTGGENIYKTNKSHFTSETLELETKEMHLHCTVYITLHKHQAYVTSDL